MEMGDLGGGRGFDFFWRCLVSVLRSEMSGVKMRSLVVERSHSSSQFHHVKWLGAERLLGGQEWLWSSEGGYIWRRDISPS